MILTQLLEDALRRNGYDGLYNPGRECSCRIGDLCPCGEPDLENCEAGMLLPDDYRCGACDEWGEPCSFHIGPGRRTVTPLHDGNYANDGEKCEACNDTGWYGDNGPGISGNREYHECDCCTPVERARRKSAVGGE